MTPQVKLTVSNLHIYDLVIIELLNKYFPFISFLKNRTARTQAIMRRLPS